MVLKKLMIVLIVVLLILPLLALAQEETDEAEFILYVGTITDEPDIFVGLAMEGEAVTLYICDGQPDEGTISVGQWFIGTIEEGAIDITAADGNRVAVTLSEETAVGSFTFTDDSVKDFTLALAEGEAALYRSEFAIGEDEYIGGWLVLADGSVRGSVFQRQTEQLVPASLVSYRVPVNPILDGLSH
jgi:hypothetical protein